MNDGGERPLFPATRRVYWAIKPLITTRWHFPSHPDSATESGRLLLETIRMGTSIPLRRASEALDEWLLTTDAERLSCSQSSVLGSAVLELLVHTIDVPRVSMSVSLGVWHLSRVLRAGKVRGLTEALHVVRRLRRARGAELYECEAELLRAAELSFAAIARNGVEPHVRAQRVDAELLAQEMDRSRLGAIRIDVSECAGISDEVKSWLLANVWSAVVD